MKLLFGLLTLSLFSRSFCRTLPNMARKLALDPFGKRQFNNPNYTGTQISFSEEEFEKRINEYYDSGMPLKDGYAPFWYVHSCIF